MLFSQRKLLESQQAEEIAAEPELERLNISKLAFHFDLDKATIKKRLQLANIEPVDVKAKETIYEVTDKLKSVLGRIDNPLDEAKLRAANADATLREAKVQQIHRELIRKDEVLEGLQLIYSNFYKEFGRLPQKIAAKLNRAKTAAECTKILKAEIERVFTAIRANSEEFLK